MNSNRGRTIIAALALALGLPVTHAAENSGLTIGLLGNLTGAASSFGVPFRNGLELALKDVATTGYLPSTKLQLATKDTNSVVPNAVKGFGQFAQEGVPVVISDSMSPIGLAVAPFAKSSKTLFLSGSSTALPNTDGFAVPWYDAITPTQTLGKYLATLKGKRVAAIIAGDNPAFANFAQKLEAAYKGAGGSSLVATQTIQSTDTDFSSILTNLRTALPDMIFLSTLPQQSGNLIRQIKASPGLSSVTVVGNVAWNMEVSKVAAGDATGLPFVQIWAPGAASSQNFLAAYTKAYGATTGAQGAMGYELGWLIAVAAKQVLAENKPLTAENLKNALPTASTSKDLAQYGIVTGFHLLPDGSVVIPGTLATFAADGSISATN